MKVAVVYNQDSKNVINLFGTPNQEIIALKTVKRITDALKSGGHQVLTLEGDKELVNRLEEFMPRVIHGERPGMVFNISYGIQGQARYTHVPSILEMVGIPYIGSGPLAHSLALDKVVSKIIFKQHGLPTADFALLKDPDFEAPDLGYPLIVKPKNEAVSFGIRIVQNEDELREAAQIIFDRFQQPVLVEKYIAGREINVGLLGNNPPEALPPAEVIFGGDGPQIYTYEDKTGKSDRQIRIQCPADLDEELSEKAQHIARDAFNSLGCCDCARVDMRLNEDGDFYILEINSLPSMGEHGSYTHAAEVAGLEYPKLVNRLVEVASARYFGTPKPHLVEVTGENTDRRIFQYMTERRELLEKRLQDWVSIQSRTSDPVGIQEAVKTLDKRLTGFAMKPVAELTDKRSAWTWETSKGFADGILFVGHLDVPVDAGTPSHLFRRDPEKLYGEGIGSSRAPLVMLELALESLRQLRLLRRLPIGVLYYTDEGRDARYSEDMIKAATSKVRRVFVLRPGNPTDRMITQRRGQRKYRLTVEGKPRRLGQDIKRPGVLRWVNGKLDRITQLSSREKRLAIATVDERTHAFPMLLPHQFKAILLMSYLDDKIADDAEQNMRQIFGREGFKWELELISDRPPMKERAVSTRLASSLMDVAKKWELPLSKESSLWPSVAGLVPRTVGVVCGVGPVAEDIYTPQESIQRIGLLQRTLLLSEFLAEELRR